MLELVGDVSELALIRHMLLCTSFFDGSQRYSGFAQGRLEWILVVDVADDVGLIHDEICRLLVLIGQSMLGRLLLRGQPLPLVFPLLSLLNRMLVLLERAQQVDLAAFLLLWNWLGSLLQQVDCPPLLI